MSRTTQLTLGSLATISAIALAQSTIEPPRRAAPPANAPVLAPPTKGPVVLPNNAPTPDPVIPADPANPVAEAPAAAPAEAKPPIATGAASAAIERARARAAARQTVTPTGVPGTPPAAPGAPSFGGGPPLAPGGPTGPGAASAPAPKSGPMATPAPADPFNPNASAATGDNQLVEVTSNPTATLDDVIAEYEANTGVTVLHPSGMQGSVAISVNGKLTKREYIDYLKAILMVNGYTIYQYGEKLHIIAVAGQNTGAFPAEPPKNGHPVFTKEADLPERDEFVNYFMKLDYLAPQDATTILGTTPPHAGGKITAIPSAGGLLITESVPVVRSLIAIKNEIDIPGGILEHKFVQLKIADAEEVAGIIEAIIQQQSAASTKAGAGGGSKLVSAPNAAAGLQAQLNPGQPGGANGATQTAPEGGSVVVKADRRTNRILLSGKKTDVAYMEKLIHEFDLPSEIENFVTYPLRFIPVAEFIDLASGALTARGFGESTGSSGGGASSGGAQGGQRQASGNGFAAGGGQSGGTNGNRLGQNVATNSRTGTTSQSRTGTAGGQGGVSGGGRGNTGGNGQISTMATPTSTTVGKTLLISDPQSNSIIVSGTPEARDQIRVLIQQMDKRPLQVHIDCIIAELSMTDDLSYGIDLLRKVDSATIGGKRVDLAGMFKSSGGSTQGIIDPSALTTIAGFPVTGGLTSYFKVGELVNAYVNASEGTGRIKVIQRPSVSTSNNETASISIGQSVPYPGTQQSYLGTNGTNGGSVNSTVEYKEVTLSLQVTPLINSKEEVTLQIDQQNDSLGASKVIGGNQVPSVNTQSFNTKLTIPNHGIAVIGGLIKDTRNTGNSSVPIIARIPIIRNLFGTTTKSDDRKELLIFMQPSIIQGPDDMIDVNGQELSRTMVGPDAMKFARPEADISDVLLPTEKGTVPYDSAGYGSAGYGKSEQPGFWKRLGGIFKRKTNVPADPAYPR